MAAGFIVAFVVGFVAGCIIIQLLRWWSTNEY